MELTDKEKIFRAVIVAMDDRIDQLQPEDVLNGPAVHQGADLSPFVIAYTTSYERELLERLAQQENMPIGAVWATLNMVAEHFILEKQATVTFLDDPTIENRWEMAQAKLDLSRAASIAIFSLPDDKLIASNGQDMPGLEELATRHKRGSTVGIRSQYSNDIGDAVSDLLLAFSQREQGQRVASTNTIIAHYAKNGGDLDALYKDIKRIIEEYDLQEHMPYHMLPADYQTTIRQVATNWALSHVIPDDMPVGSKDDPPDNEELSKVNRFIIRQAYNRGVRIDDELAQAAGITIGDDRHIE